MKIIYEPALYNLDKEKIMNALKHIKSPFIAYSAQCSGIFKGMKDSGMVLGCNCSAADSSKRETIVFVGEGRFHALNIKKNNPKKKVFVLNPFDYSIKEIDLSDAKKFINREIINIDRLKNAKNVGIISCLKPGQENIKSAELIKKKMESLGKNAFLFIAETINPDEFMNFPKIDILINTACPRIGMDDYEKFSIPIINHSIVLSEYFKDN